PRSRWPWGPGSPSAGGAGTSRVPNVRPIGRRIDPGHEPVRRRPRLARPDRLVLLPGRDRGRRLRDGRPGGPLGGRGGPARAPGGGLHRVPAGRRLRAAPRDRPGTTGTILAYDDPIEHRTPDVQVVVPDVGRLVGPPALRTVQLRLVPGRPRGGRSARPWAVVRLGPTFPRRACWSIVVDRRGARRVLRGLVHGRPARRLQPAPLVGHDLARRALPGIERLDWFGRTDPARTVGPSPHAATRLRAAGAGRALGDGPGTRAVVDPRG